MGHISQATEFDHREHNAAYSTTIGVNGSWQVDKVAEGTYNLVAAKESFGWQCVYDTNVAAARNCNVKLILDNNNFVFILKHAYKKRNT